MSYHIDIQHVCDDKLPISDEILNQWVQLTLTKHQIYGELTLRFVQPDEMTHLNFFYRKKNKVTNVLSFPANLPKEILLDVPLLGDVVICPVVLQEESQQLNKPLTEHWAHIVIHGVLHLLGFDHIEDDDARVMQAHEIQLLAELGFENPYHVEVDELEQR